MTGALYVLLSFVAAGLWLLTGYGVERLISWMYWVEDEHEKIGSTEKSLCYILSPIMVVGLAIFIFIGILYLMLLLIAWLVFTLWDITIFLYERAEAKLYHWRGGR